MSRRNPEVFNRIEPDVDMTATDGSGSNNNNMVAARTSAAASDGIGSNRITQHGETPISNIPRSRINPFDSTAQALLNYYKYNGSITLSTAEAKGHTYRLNSIYDCEITPLAYTADPTPAADAVDATVNTPAMRQYWTQWYRYWTVVRCDWFVRVIPDVKLSEAEADVYVYFHGLQSPPLSYSSGPTLNVPHQWRRNHPNMQHKVMQYLPGTNTDTNALETGVTFSGEWYPGMVRHEVHEDEFIQTWHKVTEVPPQREAFTVLIQPSDRNEAAVASMTCRVEVSLNYHVQFKDLLAKFEYTTPGSGFSAITNVSQQN